ncbi:MAG: hypothetical protein MI924_12090 [Chloroflexales bacterium]|nr:hypothetical protein [Chloroflexales bacterium]
MGRIEPHPRYSSSGNATVCFLARRCVAGWRLIQYVEAPLNAKHARPEIDV